MEAEAVLCIKCGYDSRTKAKFGREVHEEPAAWRRFFGWNPPAMGFKSMIVTPIALICFFFGSVYFAISTMSAHSKGEELLKSGQPTMGIPTGYTEFTSGKSKSKSYKLEYQYFADGTALSGKRDIDVDDLRRIENAKEPLSILFDKNNPKSHIIKGLPPENPNGVALGLIIALIAFGIGWWEYFLPIRGRRN